MVIDNSKHQLNGWYKNVFIVFFFLFFINNSYAHVLQNEAGWAHPLSGIDHILAMVAVGAWSAILGHRAIWLVPTFFVVFMFIGSLIGIAQIELPYTEQGIALSVIILGYTIAIKGKIPTILAACCTALFGVFHGFAHGYELPVIDDAFFYITGFMITTALLHILGLVFGYYLLKYKVGEKVLQLSGVLCCISGLYLFFRSF